MTFSSYVRGLAKYEPAIKAQYAYILAYIYVSILIVCVCVIYVQGVPPGYKDDALFSVYATLTSIYACLAIHEHPSKAATFVALVSSSFSLASCFQNFRVISEEANKCEKLYKNLPALDALSSRLDELGSAGSVVSVDLLSAEATQTISHYAGLCMKLHTGDSAWYTAHLAVLWAIGILCVIQSFGTYGFTLYNNPGARRWIKEHAHALMHLMEKGEHQIKMSWEKIENEAKHLYEEGKNAVQKNHHTNSPSHPHRH